ncbi:MAG: sel1 repeat family protein [Cyanobacteria bacterium J06606_4]
MAAPGIKEFRNQDYTEAFGLLQQSAQSGDAEAQCLLGNIYQLGLGGVEINDVEAMHWYYCAANQGYSIATNNLAGMVWPISSEAAAALHQLARQQGFQQADPADATAAPLSARSA